MESFKGFFGTRQTTLIGMKGNKPCRCGSGKKYKDCHLQKDWNRTSIAWGKKYGRNG